MQISRFYLPDNLVVGQAVKLSKAVTQHLLRVLRARVNDHLILFNGTGGEYHGRLIEVTKTDAVVEILNFDAIDRESPLSLHLIQGVSRSERMDYVVQKATELGVASITPLFTERSTVKLSGDRLEKRLLHWKQVAISACEQSGRCIIPEIIPAMRFEDCLKAFKGVGFVCDTTSKKVPLTFLPEQMVRLMVGPEGGFSALEIQHAKAAGFQTLSLGPRVLRTETAPVVAIAVLQNYAGDL